jgi:hypothetical protein
VSQRRHKLHGRAKLFAPRTLRSSGPSMAEVIALRIACAAVPGFLISLNREMLQSSLTALSAPLQSSQFFPHLESKKWGAVCLP